MKLAGNLVSEQKLYINKSFPRNILSRRMVSTNLEPTKMIQWESDILTKDVPYYDFEFTLTTTLCFL